MFFSCDPEVGLYCDFIVRSLQSVFQWLSTIRGGLRPSETPGLKSFLQEKVFGFSQNLTMGVAVKSLYFWQGARFEVNLLNTSLNMEQW